MSPLVLPPYPRPDRRGRSDHGNGPQAGPPGVPTPEARCRLRVDLASGLRSGAPGPSRAILTSPSLVAGLRPGSQTRPTDLNDPPGGRLPAFDRPRTPPNADPAATLGGQGATPSRTCHSSIKTHSPLPAHHAEVHGEAAPEREPLAMRVTEASSPRDERNRIGPPGASGRLS